MIDMIDDGLRLVEKEYSIGLPLQMKFCHDHRIEMFAPLDGHCYSCGRIINDNSKELITGCNWCHRSFVD